MVNRLVANRWFRGGILALVLASCGYGLSLDWPATVAALGRLHWYTMVGSLAAAMTGGWCMMLGWRCVLSDLGSPLPVATATRINFVAQLGKYVPGGVWAFAAQVELSHDRRVPRRRGTASVAISLAISIGVGLVVAAVTLPFASAGMVGRYWWALALVPVILAGLCPPVLGAILDRALRVIRQQPLERRLSWRGLVAALAWSVAGWLLYGLQVWVLLDGMTGRGMHVLLLALGGYALAFCVGLLLIVFPSGIGAREVIFIAALATTVPHGTAVALALAARLVTTISDLAWGGIGLALGRGARGVTAAHRMTAPSAARPVPAAPAAAADGAAVPTAAVSPAAAATGAAADATGAVAVGAAAVPTADALLSLPQTRTGPAAQVRTGLLGSSRLGAGRHVFAGRGRHAHRSGYLSRYLRFIPREHGAFCPECVGARWTCPGICRWGSRFWDSSVRRRWDLAWL